MPRLRGALLLLTMVAAIAAIAGCGSGSGVSLAGDAHSPTEAQQRASLLLDRLYLTGAVRAAAPHSRLDPSTPDDFVTQDRWFTIMGTATSLVARLKQQPPPGLEDASAQYATGVPVTATSASFKPTGRDNSLMQAVDVVATDAGDGRVSVQVKADVGWVAPRTTLETVPSAVTEARLAIGYGDDTDIDLQLQQSVPPAQMAALSAALASLPTTSRSEYALCFDPDIALVQLTTHYNGHAGIFDIEVGGCDEVDAEVDGVEQPLLDHDGPVVREVAAILGVTLPTG